MSTEATRTEGEFGWGAPASRGRLAVALLAAWIVPGAGHVALGRVRRGLVFAAIVLGSFGLGVAHDGRFALIDAKESARIGVRGLPGIYLSLSSLQVLANVGVGPLDTVFRSKVYGETAYVVPAEAGPERERRLQIFRDRLRSEASAYGTAYLWTAGLMNLLLLLDVWDIGRGRKA